MRNRGHHAQVQRLRELQPYVGAAICLVLGPLLLAVSALLDPAWSDDPASYLDEVAGNTGGYAASGVVSTMGTVIFIVGMLGVVRLMRRTKVSLGQIAATLVVFGLIGLTPTMAFNGIDIALSEADNRDLALRIYDAEPTVLAAYWLTFFFVGIVLGSVLLAIALFLRRIVAVWAPVLLLVSIVLSFVGTGAVLNALSSVLLTAAVVPLAMRMWKLSDEQWRRWEPLEEARHGSTGAVSPTA